VKANQTQALIMIRLDFNVDPATLLLAKSPSEYIPMLVDTIKELCFERLEEKLLYDVVVLVQDLPIAERVELLSNRELLETKIKFLNVEPPLPTVDINDIHDTWLQTTDEAIWREVYHPADLMLTYVHMKTGEIVTAHQLTREHFVCREDVIWCQHDFTATLLPDIMRFWLQVGAQEHRRTCPRRVFSAEWKYNFLVDRARNVMGLDTIPFVYWYSANPLGYVTFEIYCDFAKQVSEESDLKLSTSSPGLVSWLKKKHRALKKLAPWRRFARARTRTN
jgi:hypothetical protein